MTIYDAIIKTTAISYAITHLPEETHILAVDLDHICFSGPSILVSEPEEVYTAADYNSTEVSYDGIDDEVVRFYTTIHGVVVHCLTDSNKEVC